MTEELEPVEETSPAADRMAKARAALAAKRAARDAAPPTAPETPAEPLTRAEMVDMFKAFMEAQAATAPKPAELTGAQRVIEQAQPNYNKERVTIVLEENDNIPARGQFFGINGASFLLVPGVRASVPKGIIGILDNAIESKPVKDPSTLQVIDWRPRLRYPYRVVAD